MPAVNSGRRDTFSPPLVAKEYISFSTISVPVSHAAREEIREFNERHVNPAIAEISRRFFGDAPHLLPIRLVFGKNIPHPARRLEEKFFFAGCAFLTFL